MRGFKNVNIYSRQNEIKQIYPGILFTQGDAEQTRL